MMPSIRRICVVAAVGASTAVGSLLAAPTASADVFADCSVPVSRSSVAIVCGLVYGGQARGRGDCPAAPDVYTRWVRSDGTSYSGVCLTYVRRGILEVRAG